MVWEGKLNEHEPCCHAPTPSCRLTADVGCLQVDAVDEGKVCKQRVLPCTLDRATQMNITWRGWVDGLRGAGWGVNEQRC